MAKLGQLVAGEKTHDDLMKVWASNIETANRRYFTWANKFRTGECEEYYYGEHWEELDDEDAYRAYVTNEIFTAIDLRAPSLLFDTPIFAIRPKPSKTNFDPDAAAQRSNLREHVINYFAGHPKTSLSEATELCVLDAHFRFGVVEVGYSADWIDNPNAQAPVLEQDRGGETSVDPEVAYVPPQIPAKERVYTKHIPAENFRVGGLERAESLDRCSWCGYWEWYRYDDIVASYDVEPGGSGYVSWDFSFSSRDVNEVLDDEIQEMMKNTSLCKVWKIWDNREKVKLTIVEGPNIIIRRENFKRLPLFDLRFRKRLKSWYPIPPVYNWLSPQDEMNEIREVARQHRKRFVRKFLMSKGAIDEHNKELLVNGGDGTIAETKDSTVDPAGVLVPLPSPDLGAQHHEMLQISRIDFDNVAGITPQQRGQATSGTATETNIINNQSSIRETRDKHVVAKWLCAIGKEILLQAKEKLVDDILIPITADVDEQTSPIGEFELTKTRWMEINTDMLGDEDMEVNINVSSLSPISNEEDKRKFLEFLGILTNYPPLNLSPVLVREVATKVGYTNEQVIKEWQKYAILNMNATMAQLQVANAQLQAQSMALQANENAMAQATVAQQTPNTQDQINQQLNNQMVPQ
jgi:hypothetical protein